MPSLALRDRLAVAFALALAFAYIAILLAAVLVVNRALDASVDARLSTVAQAVVAIAGDENDEVDTKDRQQFASVTAGASGAFVLSSGGSLVLGTTTDVPVWISAAVRGAPVGRIFSTHAEGHEIRAVVERRRKHAQSNLIIVWQSMQIVRDAERTLLTVLGAFGIVVAFGSYAIGVQLVKRGLLPLTRMTAIIADIAAHDLAQRVGPQPHNDEIGRLATTFDQMLDRLQSAFERQRRFTADASHDLRAPLATLRAEVELALRRERTASDYRTALEEIARDADHLDRLIDALLAAARSDGGDIPLRPLDVCAVTRAAIAAIEPFARSKPVTITADLDVPGSILGEADLLGRAVLAVLHNAVKYTPAGASIAVRAEHHAGSVRLAVIDAGPGFSAAAREHAFERFWRDDAARGRTGSGLGLAIAQGIVQRCGGSISIDNAGGGRVTLSFPLLDPDPANERTATESAAP